jgi:O-acetyl-ADP-ribose deacetylase (regulator of RNase III)
MARITLHVGDITKDARADLIVNAADAPLPVGGVVEAFPAISTGTFGYPLEPAARIALSATAAALAECPDVARARFWLFDQHARDVFGAALARV